MKLTFLPTMTDLREMLGERLYVEFVWMWREQEQSKTAQDRRAKWADLVPVHNTDDWAEPFFTRSGEEGVAVAGPRAAQVALHPSVQRLLEQQLVNASAGALQDDEPEAARARNAAYRSAAE